MCFRRWETRNANDLLISKTAIAEKTVVFLYTHCSAFFTSRAPWRLPGFGFRNEKEGTCLKEKEGGGTGIKAPLGSLSSFDFGLRVLFLAPGFV